MDEFQKRIGFNGDIEPVLAGVSRRYKLSGYRSHELIPVGYEDYNLILKTQKGSYFVKIFASYRTRSDCQRYTQIIRSVLAHGVQHPKLLRGSIGFLCTIRVGNITLRLCVMDFIDGKNLYETKAKITRRESKTLIKQAALINSIRLRPKFSYDSWAVSSFLREYKRKRQYLRASDRRVLDSLAKRFSRLSLRKLPHSLVHGDILKTNVLRDKRGKLFIIDFSVTNFYPRIQELAVMLSSVLFDEKHPKTIEGERHWALTEYQKYISLTKYERDSFGLYCDVAHAMHVLQATYQREKVGNTGKENDYWLRLGQTGLGTNSRA